MTSKQILDEEFALLQEGLIKKYKELGMRASGQWGDSLETTTTNTNAKIMGEDYTNQLVNGRRPGSFPPVADIKKWIIDKGIANNIKGNISISSLAFLIARKIAREGTKYFQQGGTDLVSAVVTEQRMQSIINKVGEAITLEFITRIENEFKTIAV